MTTQPTPTANLMTAFEPILVELVNPTPGYQPGTGKEDGAQILQGANGCEWWAPELGCDSLDATLEAIRYRISRYLREPVAGVETATAPTPAAGEVGELVAWLLEEAVQAANSDASHSARMLTWAAQVVGEHADLMERQGAQAPQPDGWQPIDTAPRDGTEILASDCDSLDIVGWEERERNVFDWTNRELDVVFPAWWQPLPGHPPLPIPPAGEEGADG